MENPRLVIRRWREGQGLKLGPAAERIECDKSMLAYIERGERNPGRDLSRRIEDVIGVPQTIWVHFPAKQRRPKRKVRHGGSISKTIPRPRRRAEVQS